jgi:hypothetical protein
MSDALGGHAKTTRSEPKGENGCKEEVVAAEE